jgi:hypothetical protein
MSSVISALKNPPLFSAVATVTRLNDPIGTAITATTEAMLLPLVNKIYVAILGKELPAGGDKMRNPSQEIVSWEGAKEFSTYMSLSAILTYVSAQVSKKLGYEINIPRYILIANLCQLGVSMAKIQLQGRVHQLPNRGH